MKIWNNENKYQLSIYKEEHNRFNKELSNLQKQVSILQEKEENWKIEKLDFQSAIQNYENMNQRLTENEKQNQIEINQLYEKLAGFEDNSQIQDIVVANYNKLRESYQVS